MTFDEFLKGVCHLYELDWRKYRRHSARRHLDERLQQLGLSGYGQYMELLQRDSGEAAILPDLLRVTVSRFFREREQWKFLTDEVLPLLLSEGNRGIPFRAWCAGCCSGEEPYSLALLLLRGNIAAGNDAADSVEILATDIDKAVLARADKGCYGKSSVREVPADILQSFFARKGDQFCIDNAVKQMVKFQNHNLMVDEPPAGMDLLLCRYLAFTYYTGERRYRAAERLWRALGPGGVLMVGAKDRLGPREMELFEPWPETSVFFRRRN